MQQKECHILPKFQRLELGVRVLQSYDKSFFKKQQNSKYSDPKFKYSDSEKIEYRTFCACHKGGTYDCNLNKEEVAWSKTREFWTYSGRADCEPTNISNIGFNLRILDEKIANDIWLQCYQHFRSNAPFSILFSEKNWRENLKKQYPSPQLSSLLIKGLELLDSEFQLQETDTQIVGPTIEGIGYYPDLDDLKIPEEEIWVCGDASGIFRGIVAAMLSGLYVASICTDAK